MATTKPGWQMPEAPVDGAVPSFYNDGNEIWLHWTEGGEEFLPVEADGVSADIPWPFVDNYATHSDLEALGFVNADA
jgi:hypothetical protein